MTAAAAPAPTGDLEQALQDILQDIPDTPAGRKKLRDMLQAAQKLQKRLALWGPRTDDELHAWLVNNLGVNVPRTAVCEGHCSPFDFLADCYFERTTNALAMANRGGSKTFIVAVLHLLNSKFKPGTDSLTVGAVENQARRAYMHLDKMIHKLDGEADQLAKSTQTETMWKSGSRVEILPGTINAVNGPHPQKLHLDEVELFDPAVYDEAMNMPQSRPIEGTDQVIPAQVIKTSTRKRGNGLMQAQIDEIEEAKLNGGRVPTDLYTWCIMETARNVPNCQCLQPDLPEAERCPCADVYKGKWDNGTTRSLKDVCQGRLGKATGWITLNDVIGTFQSVSRDVWEAQQECKRPSNEGLVVPQFDPGRHTLRGWDPVPDLGPIFMSVDFGGTNPHAVNWYQLLVYAVKWTNAHGAEFTIPEGSLICFDEIYRAEIGNVRLAELIVNREVAWRQRHGRTWRVRARFYDPQAKAAKLDFAKHSPPLRLVRYFQDRDVKEHIKLVCELVDDDRFYVDVERCGSFVDEILAWHYPVKRPGMLDDPEKPVEDFDHCMSNFRYCVQNLRAIQRYGQGKRPGAPRARPGTQHRSSVPTSARKRPRGGPPDLRVAG